MCACVRGTSTTVFTTLSRLSGYGSINIGLPPASPSHEEVEGVSGCDVVNVLELVFLDPILMCCRGPSPFCTVMKS